MVRYGLVLKPKTALDWEFNGYSPLGAYTGLPIDHEHYLPVVEYQNNYGYDRWACVSYAILNWLEVRMIELTGIEFNYSDRFVAAGSGTKIGVGNSVATVFDFIRIRGVPPEIDYPDVGKDKYYDPIPQEIYDKAKEFLNKWVIYREWVNPLNYNDIKEALRETPLPVTVCGAFGEGELNPTGPYNHEVLLYGIGDGGHFKIFDHYTQSRKVYHKDYIFGSILKPTIISKDKYMEFKPKDNVLYQLVEGKGGFAMGLDGKLIIDDVAKILASFIVRNNGDINKKTTPITLEMYGQVDKYNLKGELLDKAI